MSRLSLATLARALDEVTTSGNAGAFPVPMGPVLTREPWDAGRRKKLPEIAYAVPEAYRGLYR